MENRDRDKLSKSTDIDRKQSGSDASFEESRRSGSVGSKMESSQGSSSNKLDRDRDIVNKDIGRGSQGGDRH